MLSISSTTILQNSIDFEFLNSLGLYFFKESILILSGTITGGIFGFGFTGLGFTGITTTTGSYAVSLDEPLCPFEVATKIKQIEIDIICLIVVTGLSSLQATAQALLLRHISNDGMASWVCRSGNAVLAAV